MFFPSGNREAQRGNTGGDHTAVVIWLHGLGDTPMGWADLAEEMSAELKHMKWRLPCAPNQPVTCNGGGRCTSWMDLIEIRKWLT
jgi:predicted esterase